MPDLPISGLSSGDPASTALVPVVVNSTTMKTTLDEAVGFWSTAAGDIPYAAAARQMARLAAPTTGAVLTYSSAASAPAWSIPTSGAVLVASSLGIPVWRAIGTSGQFLQSTGGTPTWVTLSAGATAINLPAAAWQPTANPSSFASAQLTVAQSAGSVPSARWEEWLFDPTTAEYIVTSFICPPNYTGASSPTLTVKYYSTAAVSSGVAWGVRIGGLATSGAIQSWAYGATAAASTFTLPTTAYDLGNAVITLTEGSSLLAAGNLVNLALFRNVANPGDAAAGDMHVVACEFAYS